MTRSEECRLNGVRALVVAQGTADPAAMEAIFVEARSWFARADQPHKVGKVDEESKIEHS
jgi:hypothetical protein